jgi:pyruvate ferredoxin oxidoreductase gamma subunit
MKEIRFHGRGGQGAVTAATLLSVAAFKDGKFTQAFPKFGVERRGAPVQAFTRISDEFIRRKSAVYEPDVLLILDSTLIKVVDVTGGLKEDGIVIANTGKTPEEIGLEGLKVYTVDITKEALEVLKRDIVNTGILGAFAAFTKEVKKESVCEAIEEHFSKSLAEKNVELVNRVYDKALENME